ncbi:MAG: efflux RND transporter periplasmic adaptor subunit [Pseudomonadota bacterium]
MAFHLRHRPNLRLPALLVCAALASGAAERALAHEGHDHGAPPPPQALAQAPRTEAASADFELVAVLREGVLTLYLDRFGDNAPVAGAAIEVDTPEGTRAATEASPGTYQMPAPFLAAPGAHDLAFTVTAGDTADLLAATLLVPPPAPEGRAAPVEARFGGLPGGVGAVLLVGLVAGFFAGVLTMSRRRAAAFLFPALLGLGLATAPDVAHAAEPAARDTAQRLPDGSVFLPKPSQRLLGVRTVRAAPGTFERALELPGRVVPDANGSGLVQASAGGRLAPPEGGFKPLGAPVAAGEILAYVHPPIGASDLKDLEQQGFELDQQIALVKRRYERLSAIPGSVTRREVEEAEIELKGLQTRRANLERVQREPEALRAPIAGVIATADAVAGQMAEPATVVFRILDPSRLRVEALSFAPEAGRSGAQGRLPDGRSVPLAYVGAGMAERAQAVPVLFAVTGETAGLRVGQRLTVLAGAGPARSGIALPRAALVRGANGQALVYEHADAERFVPREVRTEPLDAARVLVVAGLEPGRRVVSEGAELIDQIR